MFESKALNNVLVLIHMTCVVTFTSDALFWNILSLFETTKEKKECHRVLSVRIPLLPVIQCRKSRENTSGQR